MTISKASPLQNGMRWIISSDPQHPPWEVLKTTLSHPSNRGLKWRAMSLDSDSPQSRLMWNLKVTAGESWCRRVWLMSWFSFKQEIQSVKVGQIVKKKGGLCKKFAIEQLNVSRHSQVCGVFTLLTTYERAFGILDMTILKRRSETIKVELRITSLLWYVMQRDLLHPE